jgi:hypothetical protein
MSSGWGAMYVWPEVWAGKRPCANSAVSAIAVIQTIL